MIGKVFMILVHSVLRTFVSCLYLYEGHSVIIQVLLGKSSSLECYLTKVWPKRLLPYSPKPFRFRFLGLSRFFWHMLGKDLIS